MSVEVRIPTILRTFTGGEKAEMLTRLGRGDQSIPAGRIDQHQALVLADHEAAARSGPEPSLR